MRINEIIDFCLDNKDMPKEEFTAKLIRLLEDHSGYDLKANRPLDACKIDEQEFDERVRAVLESDGKEVVSTVEVIIEFEKKLTKKELSYLAISSIIRLLHGGD